MNMDIIHDKDNQRFYLETEGMESYVKYIKTEDSFNIISTYVPKPLEGRGIASALVKEAYDYAESLGLMLLGSCSYAEIWLKRNKR